MAATPDDIVARMITLVTALTPDIHAGDKFRAYLDEAEPSTFREWCEANPGSALRRFHIEPGGDTSQALVTSTQLERAEESITVTVAYPKNYRLASTGQQIRGLRKAINSDAVQIEAAIGVSSSDSTLKGLASIFRIGDLERDTTGPVAFLTIPYRVEYARSLA